MKNHVGMHDFAYFEKVNTLYICCNHLQQWCGMVYELNPTLFDFIDDFLLYVTHLSKHFFYEGKWIWRLVVIRFFFDIGGSITFGQSSNTNSQGNTLVSIC